ncbi:flavin containing amine oxidoreductase domain-containing protein [Sarocladium implicatum]|nr:flavin containing amine oxidoreductase domain-containing protein [Sarocladium implicatum]
MSSSTNRFTRKKVAVIGSGSAGIAALWALNRTYHDVYLYEAADRLGGHTNTVQWKSGKFTTSVDAGFTVFNETTSPNFMNFLNKLNVRTEPTDLTFSLSRDDGRFEWSNATIRSLFCRRRTIFSPRTWRTLFEILRFKQFAPDVLVREEEEILRRKAGSPTNRSEETIAEYLSREGYSDAFGDDYLIPLTAMLWSTSPDKCSLQFPIATLVRYMWNNGLLSIIGASPRWMTLADGGKSYIDAVMKGFPPNHLFLNTPVRHVSNDPDRRVRVHLENGKSEVYDHVIIATHGDQALSILNSSATELEGALLDCFKTAQNEAVLHSDTSFMPKNRKAWSSWNYLTLSLPTIGRANIDRVSVTYNMNALQHIPRNPFGDVLVTLNPLQRPRLDFVQGWYYYSHPLYTPSAVMAQKQLRNIQNTRGISYAGAWTGFGHHEDGFRSGLTVAQEHLGAKLPFELKDSANIRGVRPSLSLFDHFLRLIILLIQVFVIQIAEKFTSGGSVAIKSSLRGRTSKRANGKLL